MNKAFEATLSKKWDDSDVCCLPCEGMGWGE